MLGVAVCVSGRVRARVGVGVGVRVSVRVCACILAPDAPGGTLLAAAGKQNETVA